MKKLAIIAASILTATASFAQTEEAAPNRILVTSTVGNYKGFVVDHLDNISFVRVDGDVLADVKINEVQLNTMRLTITRTPECQYFKLAVIPGVAAKQLSDDVNAIRYINSLPAAQVPVLYEDFDNGILSGIELNPESEYAIFTVGIDRYGVEAGVSRAFFNTPAPVITGDPHVEMEFVDSSLYTFTVKFTPNDDVSAYWYCTGEKGSMQSQYEQFGPMFGFSNFSDMIKAWGVRAVGEEEHTWTQMDPNTEYEVFVAMTDVNGWFAPYEVQTFSTAALGGHGDAYVDINVGEYTLSDWNGELAPTLTISYEPNSESSRYRMLVFSAEEYAANPEACVSEVCSDPWMSTVGWYQFEASSYDYKVEPSSSIVIVAAAKNADGVWGNANVVEYTTPDHLDGYTPAAAAPKAKVAQRRNGAQRGAAAGVGVVPAFVKPAGKMQLTH